MHALFQTSKDDICLSCYSKNRSRLWEKKQVRPYPDGASTWKGNVYGVQCFFGFVELEEPRSGTNAFGLYLPDDAIVAVREWLDTVKFMKNAQVRTMIPPDLEPKKSMSSFMMSSRKPLSVLSMLSTGLLTRITNLLCCLKAFCDHYVSNCRLNTLQILAQTAA